MKASIVIPVYKPHILLEKCLDGITKNTDLNNVEVIVVCNGSEEKSAEIVLNAGHRLVWYKEPIGFTRAANIGFKIATSDAVIIMNTDSYILDFSPKNQWIDRLVDPFVNPKIGVTGLGIMWTRFGSYMPFYCAAIRRSLFDKIGHLDERFSPGYAEDADFCYRTRKFGYEVLQVDNVTADDVNKRWITDYPIHHIGEQSFQDKEKRQQYVERGHKLLEEIWG